MFPMVGTSADKTLSLSDQKRRYGVPLSPHSKFFDWLVVVFGDAEDFFDGGDAVEDFAPAVVA